MTSEIRPLAQRDDVEGKGDSDQPTTENPSKRGKEDEAAKGSRIGLTAGLQWSARRFATQRPRGKRKRR